MTPLFQQTVVDHGDLRSGDTVVTIGMSNWNQISREVRFPGINFVNAASGGAVVGLWATGRDVFNGKELWSKVPDNADIIWINNVNKADDPLPAYTDRTTADTFRVLDHIERNYLNVREVWISGLHGEPFAPARSMQPDEYAYASGVIAEDVASTANSYPFEVLHAAYLYAETTPRGDGLFWELSDFNDDRLHLSPSGNKKAARELEEYMMDAFSDVPPPEPPPPEPPPPEPPPTEIGVRFTTTRKGYYTVTAPDGQKLTKPDGSLLRVTSRDECYERITEHGQAGNYTIHAPEREVSLVVVDDSTAPEPPNLPPEWTSVPNSNWTAGIGGSNDLNNKTSDPESDALTYSHDATSTALPANVSVASNGIITATSGVTEGVTSGVRYKVSDGVNADVASDDATITIVSEGPGKRWHPGHYLRINGDPMTADQSAWMAQAESVALGSGTNSQFIGIVFGLGWKAIEPTLGNYDFSDIYTALGWCETLGNKKLVLLPTYKSFGGAPPGMHAPAEYFDQIIEHGSGNGWTTAFWRDGVVNPGGPDVRQQWADMLSAVADEFDSHPNFEWLTNVETATTLTTNAPADHTQVNITAACEYIYSAVEPHCVKSNYGPMVNSIKGGDNDIYAAQVIEHAHDIGIAIASPDARAVPGYEIFEGANAALQDYRNKMGCLTMATHSVLSTSRAGYTPAEIIDNEQNHATTHLAWSVYLQEPGRTEADILNAIDADPLLHTACPTIYPSCDV